MPIALQRLTTGFALKQAGSQGGHSLGQVGYVPLFLAGPEPVARAGLMHRGLGDTSPSTACFWGLERCRQAGNGCTASPPHANNFCTGDANSLQQKPRHTVIKVDSIHEAGVPPCNFPLFVSRSRRGM